MMSLLSGDDLPRVGPLKPAQEYQTAGRGAGDFTYEGNISFEDFVRLSQNYNPPSPA